MTDPAAKPPRRRGISVGETIALLALLVSALGLYLSWQDRQRGPAEVIEQKPAIPLVLRGTVEDGGRTLVLSPAEDSHDLDSATLALPGGKSVSAGGDGRIGAREIERALGDTLDRKAGGSLQVSADARYVEAGRDRTARRSYVLRYDWEGGGLFDDRELRIAGFSRGG
jgi:hypothetical protein